MAIETGYTYSEFDENYYYMAVTDWLAIRDENGGYKANKENKNPDVTMINRYYTDEKLIFEPHFHWEYEEDDDEDEDIFAPYNPKERDETGITVEYLDFMPPPMVERLRLTVSERIKKELDGIFPTLDQQIDENYSRPAFCGIPYCYKQKKGDSLSTYYTLHFPRYKFADLAQLPEIKEKSHGVIKTFDDLKYIVLDKKAIQAVPEEKREIFSLNWLRLYWKFCTKDIKEKIEAAGATGIKFIKSKDMNFDLEFRRRTQDYYE